jgi:excisionase family DNA binding protein
MRSTATKPSGGSTGRKTRLQLLAEQETQERSALIRMGRTERGATVRSAATESRGPTRHHDVLEPDGENDHTIEPVAVSVENAARAIGLSRTTVWELVRGGELPAKRIGGRVLIRVTDLVAFVASQPDYPYR